MCRDGKDVFLGVLLWISWSLDDSCTARWSVLWRTKRKMRKSLIKILIWLGQISWHSGINTALCVMGWDITPRGTWQYGHTLCPLRNSMFHPRRGNLGDTAMEKNYFDNCTATNDTSYKACVKGPVEIVAKDGPYFKNTNCAIGNGYTGLRTWSGSKIGSSTAGGYSVVLKLRSTKGRFATTVVSA